MEPCLPTTVMGAFPKPDYVPVSDWFDLSDRDYAARWADEMEVAGDEAEALFARAAAEVIAAQVDAGIDVVTTRLPFQARSAHDRHSFTAKTMEQAVGRRDQQFGSMIATQIGDHG